MDNLPIKPLDTGQRTRRKGQKKRQTLQWVRQNLLNRRTLMIVLSVVKAIDKLVQLINNLSDGS